MASYLTEDVMMADLPSSGDEMDYQSAGDARETAKTIDAPQRNYVRGGPRVRTTRRRQRPRSRSRSRSPSTKKSSKSIKKKKAEPIITAKLVKESIQQAIVQTVENSISNNLSAIIAQIPPPLNNTRRNSIPNDMNSIVAQIPPSNNVSSTVEIPPPSVAEIPPPLTRSEEARATLGAIGAINLQSVSSIDTTSPRAQRRLEIESSGAQVVEQIAQLINDTDAAPRSIDAPTDAPRLVDAPNAPRLVDAPTDQRLQEQAAAIGVLTQSVKDRDDALVKIGNARQKELLKSIDDRRDEILGITEARQEELLKIIDDRQDKLVKTINEQKGAFSDRFKSFEEKIEGLLNAAANVNAARIESQLKEFIKNYNSLSTTTIAAVEARIVSREKATIDKLEKTLKTLERQYIESQELIKDYDERIGTKDAATSAQYKDILQKLSALERKRFNVATNMSQELINSGSAIPPNILQTLEDTLRDLGIPEAVTTLTTLAKQRDAQVIALQREKTKLFEQLQTLMAKQNVVADNNMETEQSSFRELRPNEDQILGILTDVRDRLPMNTTPDIDRIDKELKDITEQLKKLLELQEKSTTANDDSRRVLNESLSNLDKEQKILVKTLQDQQTILSKVPTNDFIRNELKTTSEALEVVNAAPVSALTLSLASTAEGQTNTTGIQTSLNSLLLTQQELLKRVPTLPELRKLYTEAATAPIQAIVTTLDSFKEQQRQNELQQQTLDDRDSTTQVQRDRSNIGTQVQRDRGNRATQVERGQNNIATQVQRDRDSRGTQVERAQNNIATQVERGQSDIGTQVERRQNDIATQVERGQSSRATQVERGQNNIGTQVERGQSNIATQVERGQGNIGTQVERGQNNIATQAESDPAISIFTQVQRASDPATSIFTPVAMEVERGQNNIGTQVESAVQLSSLTTPLPRPATSIFTPVATVPMRMQQPLGQCPEQVSVPASCPPVDTKRELYSTYLKTIKFMRLYSSTPLTITLQRILEGSLRGCSYKPLELDPAFEQSLSSSPLIGRRFDEEVSGIKKNSKQVNYSYAAMTLQNNKGTLEPITQLHYYQLLAIYPPGPIYILSDKQIILSGIILTNLQNTPTTCKVDDSGITIGPWKSSIGRGDFTCGECGAVVKHFELLRVHMQFHTSLVLPIDWNTGL